MQHTSEAYKPNERQTMTEIDAIINAVEFRLHESVDGTFCILNGDNEVVFKSSNYSDALRVLETEYLTPEQVEALHLHHEVMEEMQAEDRANRGLSCDHYAGF
jgi:citrate lyase synthetase